MLYVTIYLVTAFAFLIERLDTPKGMTRLGWLEVVLWPLVTLYKIIAMIRERLESR